MRGHFNGTAISTTFLLLQETSFSVIHDLNLNNSESAMLLSGSYLQYYKRYYKININIIKYL